MGLVDYKGDYSYANSRLSNSVVRDKNGNPIYVEYVESCGSVNAYNTMDKSHEALDIEDLNLEPVPLGFVNLGEKGASYSCRTNVRSYRQGLTTKNIMFFGKSSPIDGVRMAHTIKGIYPKAEDCAENVLCEEAPSMAFCREFALSKTGLVYKDRTVGAFSWNQEACKLNFNLYERFYFLNEMLEERVNV